MGIIRFSSEIVSAQIKMQSNGSKIWILPYAMIQPIPFKFELADYYIFTSRHAVRQVLSRVRIKQARPVFISGQATAELVRKYWPEAQVILGKQQGISDIKDFVRDMPGLGRWYRGVDVVDQEAFEGNFVVGVPVYQLISLPKGELMVQLYQERKIDLICFDSIQQAKTVECWGKQFLKLPVLARSERIAVALSQRGWANVTV